MFMSCRGKTAITSSGWMGARSLLWPWLTCRGTRPRHAGRQGAHHRFDSFLTDQGEAYVGQPLGIHEASVSDTSFLDGNVGEDLGMNRPLEMTDFSAQSGDGLTGPRGAAFQDREEPALIIAPDDEDKGQNHAPVVSGGVDLGSMNEDGNLIVTTAELLALATDADGDILPSQV
jgi:hypothetical protein